MSETTEAGPAPGGHGQDRRGRAPRWLWLLLIGSLAVNLLVAGAALGGMWAWKHRPPGGPMLSGLIRYVHHLPNERAATLSALLEAQRPALEAKRAEITAARRAAAEALSAEPFDRAALEAALRRLQQAEQAPRDLALSAITAVAAAMTPAERADLRRHLSHRKGPLADSAGPGGP